MGIFTKKEKTIFFIAIAFSFFLILMTFLSPPTPPSPPPPANIPSDGAFVQFYFKKGLRNLNLEVIPADPLLEKKRLGGMFNPRSCIFEVLPDVPTKFSISLNGGKDITTASSLGRLRCIRIDAKSTGSEPKGLRTIISYWSLTLTDEGFCVPSSRDKPKFPRRQTSPAK